ncbi:hypothetical protein [Variovorax guangxiensis]|nr:hypothetical protein [Variovorax guangxiensis]MDR6859483.1 hypothetical protein [Variovorax guangxiensis]
MEDSTFASPTGGPVDVASQNRFDEAALDRFLTATCPSPEVACA